jgi:hypothetical protein
MPYTLTITPKPAFLHAVVTGENSVEHVMRYLDEIQRECRARNCFRVLIEERLEGPRLDAKGVFQIASEGSRRVRVPFKAIAYVDANTKGDLMKFAETVATNLGLPVSVFSTVGEAEQWLRLK